MRMYATVPSRTQSSFHFGRVAERLTEPRRRARPAKPPMQLGEGAKIHRQLGLLRPACRMSPLAPNAERRVESGHLERRSQLEPRRVGLPRRVRDRSRDRWSTGSTAALPPPWLAAAACETTTSGQQGAQAGRTHGPHHCQMDVGAAAGPAQPSFEGSLNAGASLHVSSSAPRARARRGRGGTATRARRAPSAQQARGRPPRRRRSGSRARARPRGRAPPAARARAGARARSARPPSRPALAAAGAQHVRWLGPRPARYVVEQAAVERAEVDLVELGDDDDAARHGRRAPARASPASARARVETAEVDLLGRERPRRARAPARRPPA